ncbi:hypothetical protein [Arthrobacter sp. efr-133-TYG-118]|uniref:hypothetical protein n=1 Tax=Arthrobacter sp. efr-133-TYG-118 TaxID=3040279 RepID=UPI00254B3A35|nr:hypothetical protein [Arthrobacter sp. efr-133-TYG-118]
MDPGLVFGLAIVALGCVCFAVSRPLSAVSAKIRIELGQKLDKQAFISRNGWVLRIMALVFVILGLAIAILGEIGRGA